MRTPSRSTAAGMMGSLTVLHAPCAMSVECMRICFPRICFPLRPVCIGDESKRSGEERESSKGTGRATNRSESSSAHSRQHHRGREAEQDEAILAILDHPPPHDFSPSSRRQGRARGERECGKEAAVALAHLYVSGWDQSDLLDSVRLMSIRFESAATHRTSLACSLACALRS